MGSDLHASNDHGLLTFREPSPLAYGTSLMLAPTGGAAPRGNAEDNQQIGGKSVAEWKAEQAQFSHLPKMPEGWIRVKARNSDDVYFWNTKTKTSQFHHPLPDGWTKQRSKTSGKVYYFNAKKR